MRKRWGLAAATVAALAAGVVASPVSASEDRAYKDYVGPNLAPLARLGASAPEEVITVSPSPSARAVALPDDLAELVRTAKVHPQPTTPMKPFRMKSPTKNGRLAASTTTVCNYSGVGRTGTPAPPVSGQSFAVAKSINGAPRSTAAKNPGIFMGGQAAAVQSGTGSTTSRTATAEVTLTYPVGSGWPAGTAFTFYYNPLFRGRGTTQSAIGPLQQASTASVRHRLQDSVGFNGETSYRTVFDFSLSNDTGVGKTTPIYSFGGYPVGTAQQRSIPVTGIGNYVFRVRTLTNATADSAPGSAASAIMDFGSGVVDTPAGLSPYNFYTMPNGNTSTWQPYGHLTIAITLPAPFGVSC